MLCYSGFQGGICYFYLTATLSVLSLHKQTKPCLSLLVHPKKICENGMGRLSQRGYFTGFFQNSGYIKTEHFLMHKTVDLRTLRRTIGRYAQSGLNSKKGLRRTGRRYEVNSWKKNREKLKNKPPDFFQVAIRFHADCPWPKAPI